MAVVPDDQIASVQQEPLPGRAFPHFSDQSSPADFGYGLGEGLEHAAAVEKQQQDKANAQADRVKAAQVMLDADKWTNAKLYGADTVDPKAPHDASAVYRQSGDALPNLAQATGQQFSDFLQQRLAQEPEHVRDMVAEHLAGKQSQLDLETRRYVYQEQQRVASETFSNVISQQVQNAGLSWRDPHTVQAAIDQTRMAGSALAEQGGKDSLKAWNEGGYKKAADGIVESAIGGALGSGDIRTASTILNQYQDQLSSGVKHEELANRIRAAGDRIEAKQKDAARDTIADLQSAALQGLPIPPAMESKAQAAYQTIYKNDWQAHYAFLDKARVVGSAKTEFANMTPSQIEARVNQLAPTEARPGVAQDLELHQRLMAAARQAITERAADPRAYANQATQQPDIDFSQGLNKAGAQLTSRYNTLQDDSRRLGVPMQMLSKEEARQLGGALNQAPPGQRLALLQQLHASIPDERAYSATLNQVLPHSPVSSIVGAKVDPPKAAQAPVWYDPKFGPSREDGLTILKGEQLLNPPKGQGPEKGGFKGGFPMPQDNKYQGPRAYFEQHAGDVFANRPELADAAYTAFRGAYAQLSSEKGDLTGQWDPVRAKEAMQKVTGQMVQYGRQTVIVPPGLDPARFGPLVDNAIAVTAKATGAPADWKDRLAGVRLEEQGGMGSGRYTLVDGNRPVPRPDGKGWFTIDLGQQYKHRP